MNRKKSKIIPMSRFTALPTPLSDFVSGSFDSEIMVLNKGATGRKIAKSQPWLVKKKKDAKRQCSDEQFNVAIKNRCEVFSAWQYESFIGDGSTQPKYYLVQEPGELDSVATKFISDYTSLNVLLSTKPTQVAKVLSQPKNLKLFAQMLVNYLWLAASDFKLDHIGIDTEQNLVCIDFGESLIPFQYTENVFKSRGWDFSITSKDLCAAPFFTRHKSSNYFIERATDKFPGIFDFLRNNADLTQQICIAILKRCIFPSYISFAGLELFHAFEECGAELQEFMEKRTEELRSAAMQNPIFLHFMQEYSENAYEDIKAELLAGPLANSRYFRNDASYKKRCLEELRFNFENIATEITFSHFEDKNCEAINVLRILRQFCESQYIRLKKIDENAFFRKGSTDKSKIFKRLLDRIDAVSYAELAPDKWVNLIEKLIKETAIVAHHRRYSKINTFFRHTESTSWKDFTTFFSGYTGEYSSIVQEALVAKSGRSTAISEGITVSGYNDYRDAVKGHRMNIL